MMGLLIDREGRPIGYELFSGNTFEGKTLEVSLDKLKKRFTLGKVIIVADRGINSKINLMHIRDKGYDYILASRIKTLKKEIFKDDYHKMGKISYKIINYINKIKENKQTYELPENLLITYSPQKSSKEVNWALNEEAIKKDEMFDGYYGIETSEKNLKPQDILEAYHDLWKIEESFRIMKSILSVRPVFHWTESRIKGHFLICFLAFLLERTLELKLKKANLEASPQKIQEVLNSMNFAEVKIEKRKFLIKTKFGRLGSKILRLLHIKPPKNLTPTSELSL